MNILDRFLKYVKIDSSSISYSDKIPSTDEQRNMAKVLVQDLKDLGLDVYYDEEHCYVYGLLKGNVNAPGIGFITHMDTSEDAPGKGVNPQIINDYDGSSINLKNGVVLSKDTSPDLQKMISKTLITSDGTTLLGADDKAGIAEVMNMLEYFATNNDAHGDIAVCFTPDEELGKDTEFFDLAKFPVKYAYTVDGTKVGEITYDNFNAASIEIVIKGNITHLGWAKGILVNSLIIAHKLFSLIPNERPENTEGYEGYYHLLDIAGNETLTTMNFIIRDFDKQGFEKRKKVFIEAVQKLNAEYDNRISMTINDSYFNMREVIDENWHLVEKAKEAMRKLGVKPISEPIRGGTTGARLSFKGLPCPNLGTGGYNFHSCTEFVALEDMQKASEILIQIVKEYSLSKDEIRLEKKNPKM